METDKTSKIDRQIDRIFRVVHLVLRYLIALFLIFQYPYLHHKIATISYKANELYLSYSAWGALLGLFIFYSKEIKEIYVIWDDYIAKRENRKKQIAINEYKASVESKKTQE